MKIPSLVSYSTSFKAHSYKFEPKSGRLFIETDNNPNLGNEPYLVYKAGTDEVDTKPMEYQNGLYTTSFYIDFLNPNDKVQYHITYSDTGGVDKNNGKEYELVPYPFLQSSIIKTRNQYRQPLIHALNSGKTVGRIFCKDKFNSWDSIDDINEPTIIVTNTFHTALKNPNVVGVIFTSFDSGALSHMSTQFRNNTDICASIFDTNCIQRLKELNGKIVELEVHDEEFQVEETCKIGTPKQYSKVEIPEQKIVDRILTSQEYSPDIVGSKALNLRRLEELVERGKIDVKIPKSIALPHAWVQHLFDENKEQKVCYNQAKECYICKEEAPIWFEPNFENRMQYLIQDMQRNGLDVSARHVMVRSSFNGEDLSNYSAAGLYKSVMSEINPSDLYEAIVEVAQSKWSDDAVYSMQQHSIDEKLIKPTILIQDCIVPEYKFTVYTDYENKNKLRIDMYSDGMIYAGDDIQPHVFEYDRKTNELTYKSIQMVTPKVCYDENFNEQLEPIQNDLTQRPNVFRLVKKLVENALVIEKEFGQPQDIEGGFVGDDIYLWQTRNIVK